MLLWMILLFYAQLWQVSGVAFDSYWLAPNSDGVGENIVYRFGSVGQVSKEYIYLFHKFGFMKLSRDNLSSGQS